MNFGIRLKQLREGKNMSQAELEGKTGISRYHLSKFEQGHRVNPTLSTIEKCCTALDTPLSVFFHDPETPSLEKENWDLNRRLQTAIAGYGKLIDEVKAVRKQCRIALGIEV